MTEFANQQRLRASPMPDRHCQDARAPAETCAVLDLQTSFLYGSWNFCPRHCRNIQRQSDRIISGQLRFLLFPLLPVLLLYKGDRAFKRQYLWFWILVGGWLLGTIIADFYFSTPLTNRLKGTARVVIFAANFATLAILVNDKTRRMVLFALSLAVVMGKIGMEFAGDTLTHVEIRAEWRGCHSGFTGLVPLL